MAHSVSEYLTLKSEDESAIVSNLLPHSGALNIFGAPKPESPTSPSNWPTPSAIRASTTSSGSPSRLMAKFSTSKSTPQGISGSTG